MAEEEKNVEKAETEQQAREEREEDVTSGASAKEQPSEEKSVKDSQPVAGADAEKKAEPDNQAAATETKAEKADSEAAEEKPAAARVSRQTRYGVVSGIVHVMATFNNTKVTITDQKGNVIAWRSAGRCGFKGSRKSTAYAATIVAQEATREAASKGLREAQVRLNGPGAGRESAVRAVHAARIKVTAIQDVTPIPHNGCRPPKRRRV